MDNIGGGCNMVWFDVIFTTHGVPIAISEKNKLQIWISHICSYAKKTSIIIGFAGSMDSNYWN